MGKRSAGDRPDAGPEALTAQGIDRAGLASGSIPIERLGQILAAGTDASLALAHLLGEVPRAEHAELLAAANDAAHGPLRREVRRALYRLRQAGIEPPVPPATPEVRGVPGTIAAAEPEGWLSHVDGRGDQLVWVTKAISHGLLFVAARINDREGLCELSAVEISKRQFRAQRDELRDRHGLRMVGVDWRYADALIAAANARSAPSAGPPYPTVRARFTTAPAAALEPPIYSHIPPEEVADELVTVSAELLETPEFRSWMPAPADLEPHAEAILDARASPLVLNRFQQDDRLNNILDRAVRDLYPHDVFVPRFEAIAFYFWQTGRERPARLALACARALAGGSPAGAIPALAALLRQSLAAVYEAARARVEETEQSSLIVKPGTPAATRR